MGKTDLRYLKSLSNQYPTIAAAATEIINLQAILSLPKGTEHFITDIHGEYEQFRHVLKNGSGAIKRKIEEEFGNDLSEADKKNIAALIYYPREKLKLVLEEETNMEDWYKVTLHRLIRVCKSAASKYTRSKVRKALPADFSYIMEELLNGHPDMANQEAYYNEIINAVIRTGRAQELIVAFCRTIRRLVVDQLHVLGDIFDRGPYPHLVMDTLTAYHNVDIQWGNHDISWMGAAAGNPACIATVIRISAKYGNLNMLEDGYGINLVPLARFAMNQYAEDKCECFKVDYREENYDVRDAFLDEKMHKAITIIQLKLEGQLILRHPEFHMEDRLLLDKLDLEKGTVKIDGKEYEMKDKNFPTLYPDDRYRLTPEEEDVVDRLTYSFVNCEKLQSHIRFLYANGGLYKIFNGNLLYHGCVPMTEEGEFEEVEIYGKKYTGRELYDVLEGYARKAYYSIEPEEKQKGADILWFIWANRHSPVFGKEKMTTFERYFVEDKETHTEPKNPYYRLLEKEETVNKILEEFGLKDNEYSHIINGHIPVESKRGESPIKCNGKLLIIDGGFSKAYQPKTGIAGYTLIYNSYGLVLAAHEPFESVDKAVREGQDIHSHMQLVQQVVKRKLVADTDAGKEMQTNIEELEELLLAYREGRIVEKG